MSVCASSMSSSEGELAEVSVVKESLTTAADRRPRSGWNAKSSRPASSLTPPRARKCKLQAINQLNRYSLQSLQPFPRRKIRMGSDCGVPCLLCQWRIPGRIFMTDTSGHFRRRQNSPHLRREDRDMAFLRGGHHSGIDPAAGLPDRQKVLEQAEGAPRQGR